MPVYEYFVTLANGEIKKHEGTFSNSNEILNEVLEQYKGKWIYKEDGHGHEYFVNNEIAVNLKIVDIVKDDIRAKKVSEQFLGNKNS